MTRVPSNKPIELRRAYQISLTLVCIESIALLVYFLSFPSKAADAFLAGFSIKRILLLISAFILLGVTCTLIWDAYRSGRIFHFFTSRLKTPLSKPFVYSFTQAVLFLVLLISLIYSVHAINPDASIRMVPLLSGYSDRFGQVVGQWGEILILLLFLICLKLFILLSIFGEDLSKQNPISALTRWSAFIWAVAGLLFLLYIFRDSIILRVPEPAILLDPAIRMLILAVWLSTWDILRKKVAGAERFFLLFASISIWLATYSVYMQLTQWMHATETPINNYFNLLADSFLHGRLYLPDPPSTYDLTLSGGRWYVPFPPFPAVLLLPFIAIWGVSAFNTVTFSIILGACTNVCVFMILHQAAKLGWIHLKTHGILWLVALFSFGTVFWWLASLTLASFFSQTCTVFISALAFWFALKKYPAWLVGAMLAAAVMTRPNVLMLWPALAAITIHLEQSQGRKDWKRLIRWGIYSAIPIVLGVILLLTYNHLRFGDLFDFGYKTISGWDWLVERANEYGVFSPHFIPSNLSHMFLGVPFQIIAECDFFIPRGNGMSIFFTTPAVIYLFRRFKISWWTGGCWVAIFLSITMLSMYHNVGAIQYGYRYMMDFIIPILMLIAFNAGKKVSTPLKFLIVLSILINYYGIVSWFQSPC